MIDTLIDTLMGLAGFWSAGDREHAALALVACTFVATGDTRAEASAALRSSVRDAFGDEVTRDRLMVCAKLLRGRRPR